MAVAVATTLLMITRLLSSAGVDQMETLKRRLVFQQQGQREQQVRRRKRSENPPLLIHRTLCFVVSRIICSFFLLILHWWKTKVRSNFLSPGDSSTTLLSCPQQVSAVTYDSGRHVTLKTCLEWRISNLQETSNEYSNFPS